MNKFRVSNRYTNFFCTEIFSTSLIHGDVRSPSIGGTPISFKTDASAREIAASVVNDNNNGSVDSTLILDGTSIMTANSRTLNRVLEIWGAQGHLADFSQEVLVGEVIEPDKDENLRVLNHLLNLPIFR